jgi:uncharacterized membrane protein
MNDQSAPQLPDISPAVHRVELIISTLLRAGVAISFIVILTGTIFSFIHHPSYLQSPQSLTALTTPGRIFPHSLHDTFAGLRAGSGQAIIVAGLLLLIATPVMRVAISIFAFALQKDWIFTLLTTAVLAFLLLSFLLGHAGA